MPCIRRTVELDGSLMKPGRERSCTMMAAAKALQGAVPKVIEFVAGKELGAL